MVKEETGVVVHACNPGTWNASKSRRIEFKARLGYLVRPYLQKEKK
jgi:hypothetical protein